MAPWLPHGGSIEYFSLLEGGSERTMAHKYGIDVSCLAILFGLFDYALHVPFPRGVVLDWLKV